MFATELKKARKQANKTQEELSNDSAIANRYFQKLEAAENEPTISMLFKLSKGLGISPDLLIKSVWEEWCKAGYPEEP